MKKEKEEKFDLAMEEKESRSLPSAAKTDKRRGLKLENVLT